MRALVTGASGFVGHYLIQHLVERGDEVLGTIFPGTKLELSVRSVELDICDASATASVISEFKPQVIYHLAGLSFPPEAEDYFDRALSANVYGTHSVYRVAHLLQSGIKVVSISSAEVYGKILPSELPINEGAPIRPMNNYSLSKAMAELVAERYLRQGFVHSVVLRPFNHIGPGQNNRFVASSFASQLANIGRGKAQPVLLVGNLDAKRDFSDVRDIVKAYRLAGERGQGIYNLGSGRSISIRALLDMLIKISGLKVEIRIDPSRLRPAEVPEIYGDCSKAKRELGWAPELEIEDTLRDIYRYWYDRIV